MVSGIEIEPGARIEDFIVAEILGTGPKLSIYGLAVTVEKLRSDVFGVAKTAQPKGYSPLETNLRMVRPKKTANGAIYAIDSEHNALWLRPQRLTSTAVDAGFLVVPQFVQDGEAAYSVTAREASWRDGEPFEGLQPGRFQKYVEGGDMPDLVPQQWARLHTPA